MTRPTRRQRYRVSESLQKVPEDVLEYFDSQAIRLANQDMALPIKGALIDAYKRALNTPPAKRGHHAKHHADGRGEGQGEARRRLAADADAEAVA